MLRATIEEMKNKVQFNLNKIHENERMIRELLKKPVSTSRSEQLEEKFSLNKEMLRENKDAIKIQLSLVQFLNEYRDSLGEYEKRTDQIVAEVEKETTENKVKEQEDEAVEMQRIFNLTVAGELPYDEHHPFYEDTAFIDHLLEHYQEHEEYEKCAPLVEMRNSIAKEESVK
jgi:hypothetical protein